MPRGRPPNILRNEARERGDKTYTDAEPCFICGESEHYVSNAACVACAIAAGQLRYSNKSEREHAAQRRADHARYLRRRAAHDSAEG